MGEDPHGLSQTFPDTATAEDLRRFQLHLVESGVGSPSLNSAVTALQFFFEVTVGHGEVMAKVSHVHEPRKLPVILSPEEIMRLLESAPGLKYKAALAVAYGAGLRASEVVALKVDDIDSKRMAVCSQRFTASNPTARVSSQPCRTGRVGKRRRRPARR